MTTGDKLTWSRERLWLRLIMGTEKHLYIHIYMDVYTDDKWGNERQTSL